MSIELGPLDEAGDHIMASDEMPGSREESSDKVMEPRVAGKLRQSVYVAILCVALLFYGATGGVFNLIEGQRGIRKTVTTYLSLMSTVTLTWMLLRGTITIAQLKARLTNRAVLALPVAGLSFGFAAISFFWSVQYTTIAHATLLHDSHPLILVLLSDAVYLGLYVSRRAKGRGEAGNCPAAGTGYEQYVEEGVEVRSDVQNSTGAQESLWTRLFNKPNAIQNACVVVGFLAVLGMLTLPKAAAHHVKGESQANLAGDIAAFMGAFGIVGYIITLKWVSPRLNLPHVVIVWLYYLPYACAALGVGAIETYIQGRWDWTAAGFVQFLRDYIVCFNPQAIHGVLITASCAASALVALTVAMPHFPAQVVSIAMLSEPLIASIVASLLGFDEPPGVITVLLGLVLLSAIGVVSLYG